jgi:putative hydrolase of the HAD superfamily
VIELVTFDFWQTLLADSADGLRQAHALRLERVGEALARAGHPVDAARLAAADQQALAGFEAVWRTDRDLAASQQVGGLLDALDPALAGRLAPASRTAVERAYQDAALAHPPVLSAGAAEAIRALRRSGRRLAVISNTGRTPGRVLRQLLAGAGLLDAFAVLSFSDEVGLRKPDPGIFATTLRRAGHGPGVAAHIGDDARADVGGARRAGMAGLHYVPYGQPHGQSHRAGAADADGVVRHLAELPAVLAELERRRAGR